MEMIVKVKIPATSGTERELPFSAGDIVFALGPNGSGKSHFLRYVSKNAQQQSAWLPAFRQNFFESASPGITPSQRGEFGKQFANFDSQPQAAWLDRQPAQRLNTILFDLIQKDNQVNAEISELVRSDKLTEAKRTSSFNPSPIQQINETLKIGGLSFSVQRGENDQILANKRGETFSFIQMSDGERAALLLSAWVVTKSPGSVLLIDEPERHLHRSISAPLLACLIRVRDDCAFLISTHDVDLVTSFSDTRIILLRDYCWEGQTVSAFDYDEIDKKTDITEDIKKSILGARRKVVFVEGRGEDTRSLDFSIYRILLPEASVIPCGSCSEVIRKTEGCAGSQTLNWIEAFGIIDRDDRDDEDVEGLKRRGIFAINVHSVEALYFSKEVLYGVAGKIAEIEGCNPNERYRAALEAGINSLREGDAERMSARVIERRLERKYQEHCPTWKQIRDTAGKIVASVKIDVSEDYKSQLAEFERLREEMDVPGLFARFPMRETSVHGRTIYSLGCSSTTQFYRMAIQTIQNEDELFRTMRAYLGSLVDQLEKSAE